MTIWLFGDSIFHGEAGERDLLPHNPLWPIRAPAQILELLLGPGAARLGGRTKIPEKPEAGAADIAGMIGREIGPEDAIVMLDVGSHSGDPDLHERQWLTLRGGAAAHPGQVLICEGFDNGAKGHADMMHRRRVGGRSPNDAVRAAADAPVAQAGRTVFVPTAKPLLRFHHAARTRWRVGGFRRDGVHLNPWGRARLSWLILEAAGHAGRADVEGFRTFAEQAWEALGCDHPVEARALAGLALRPSKDLYGDLRAA